MTDPLKATLLDLLYELRDADVPLLLGGGYGLYRKQEATLASDAPERTDGETFTGTVYLPPTYAFLMMKLFTRNDQKDDSCAPARKRRVLPRLRCPIRVA